jgi:AcrR family transcriptional regulator
MVETQRRIQRIGRTRDDILDAAARAFARAGYRAATMRDIASEAGYTAPSLYTYFDSKQDIYVALVDRLTEAFLATFQSPLPAGLALGHKLELLLRRQLELADARRDDFAVFFAMSAVDYVSRAEAKPAGFDRFAARFGRWLAEHARPDELGGRDPEHLGFALAGIQYAFFRRWLRGAPRQKLADQTLVLVDLFLHGCGGKRGRKVGA